MVFSDGEDSRSELSQGEVNKLVRSAPVTIFSIAFSPDGVATTSRALKGRQVLQHLADLTGGDVYAPGSYRDLPEIYDKILDELQAQYVLGFVSDRPAGDGKYRKLRVEVARKGVKLRHRTGYLPLTPETSASN